MTEIPLSELKRRQHLAMKHLALVTVQDIKDACAALETSRRYFAQNSLLFYSDYTFAVLVRYARLLSAKEDNYGG